MSDFLYQLEQALLENNLKIIGNIKFTDKPQRFKCRSNPNGGRNVFVILHGDRGASFGDWRYPEGWQTWWKEGKLRLTTQDRIDLQLQREKLDRLRFKRQQFCVNKALKFWLKYPSTPDVLNHPYIKRKRINPYYTKSVVKDRWIRNVLMVPVRDVDYKLQTIQIIKPNGFKRIWKGTTYKNHMIWLHPLLPRDYKGVIYLCEGYATGCTIYQIMGLPVICALNAYNLQNATIALRRKYVHANIQICADNDALKKENVGRIYGELSAKVARGHLHYPVFNANQLTEKTTDFNDLFSLMGKEETKRQLILPRPIK